MLEILIADDHKLLRDGLKLFLSELADNVVVLEAGSFKEAMTVAATAHDLRLIVLDLGMPSMNGMQGVETISTDFPNVPLAILSGDTRRETVLAAVQAGATGFIAKTISGAALVNALRLVMARSPYLPSQITADAVNPEEGEGEDQAAFVRSSPLEGLNARDREILALVVEGLTNKEIGRRIGLQEVTIKAHLRSLYRRIGAINRAQAVRIALQR